MLHYLQKLQPVRFYRDIESCGAGGPIVDVIVRREKALDFSGCNSRPGTGSLHPVAIEAAVAVTKLSELSMERVARRPRERAGHNVSER
jgi:hypothetical protein